MKETEVYRTVFQQTLLNKASAKERIDERTQGTTPERKHVRISRRTAIAIAVAAVLLTVGSAAAATSFFARQNYTPANYLNQNEEQRTKNGETIPDVEQALKAARPADVSCTVRMMPEIDTNGVIAGWREYMGQPPYNEADWAWVRDLKPTIGDVIFDGRELYVTTRIETDRPEVFEWYTETDQKLWIACEGASYTAEGDAEPHAVALIGESQFERIDDGAILVQAQADLSRPEDRLPEDGILTMTEQLYVVDGRCDDMQPTRAAIAIIDFTFTFDAAASRPAAETQHVSIPLSGEHIVTVHTWSGPDDFTYSMTNRVLPLDGVVLDAKIEYRPVGVYVTIGVKDLPPSWTEWERASLIQAMDDVKIDKGACAVCRINGETVPLERMNYGSNDAVYLLLPIYPSEYADVSSVTIDLFLQRVVSANGSEPRDDWSYTLKLGESIDISETATEPLTSFTVPIPKNN